ncbi:MAG TPA: DUF512 domain-containing protein, partial [Candidatus Marinimicrobia bacterium]|nr:DUF512 domain-containing protein [Candidatus Neomarinimicrobiota bacterium]
VLIPGVNDGTVLEKTLADLFVFRDSILSVAIVPVGLTAHRQHLPIIPAVDSHLVSQLLENIRIWNRRYVNRDEEHWVFLSDEFYLLVGQDLPGCKFYGSFYQIENGVGTTRAFLDDFKRQSRKLPHAISKRKRVLFVTGMLAAPVLSRYVTARLNQINNFSVDILPVINNFFGPSVTVAGLLTGQDILAQAINVDEYDLIVLPPRIVNEDGILLDDLYPYQIAEALHRPVQVWDGDFGKLVDEDNG